MAMSKLRLSIKRPPFGFLTKVLLVVLLGLSFVVVWSTFSSPSSSVLSQRSSFGDIESEEETKKGNVAHMPHKNASTVATTTSTSGSSAPLRRDGEEGEESEEKSERKGDDVDGDGTHIVGMGSSEIDERDINSTTDKSAVSNGKSREVEKDDIKEVPHEEDGTDENLDDDDDDGNKEVDETEGKNVDNKWRNKIPEHLFDSKMDYDWKLCSGRTVHNYIPCIDLEGTGSGKLQSHRRRERKCPNMPLMCLIPLPQGYESPIIWPESKHKIFYGNVVHPKLSAFLKTQGWLKLTDKFLTFPGNVSVFRDGADHYLDFIGEMVPDIDWGKNIRVVLDIGCTDASFGISLLQKDALALSLGLMGDQTDLAQLFLERGILAVLGNLGSRKLPFPDGVFDAIHCGECNIPWHSHGGRILLEMNRLLRPGGYFFVSFGLGDIERDEAISNLTTAICWNTLAHKTDDETDLNVKIYQRPSSNDVYELKRTKYPPLCKNEGNQDVVWYSPIERCLHTIPASIEQRGTDWPEEWPKRLEIFPEWLAESQEKLMVDTEHWKAIINKSYLNGMGIDWSHVRNVMDMKASYGGFAAALSLQKVWVMNVVPVHLPNTLPIIFERGLLGIYHDWCEPFSTYPRSYDLLHADHLFSRLKDRCRHPLSIVVEMDRILRPGGWAIVRDKLEILNPLESILKSLHWDITMTFAQNKQGIICAQKTTWRP